MRIKLYEHPFAPVAPRIVEVPSLAQWLLDHYGDAPQVKVQVFRGDPSAESEITGDLQAILNADADEYVILQSPAGIETGLLAIVALVAAIAVVLLIPKPAMPGNLNRTQESPNNALGSRENKLRMLERVEDIYGSVRAIPSLMMPTYQKYINHRKFEYGYYCVGRGYYDITEIRDGDTLLSEIDGASAAIYDPFTSPNSGDAAVIQIGDPIIDQIVTVSRQIEVDGITLEALNQVQLPTSAVYTFSPNVSGGIITQGARQPNVNSISAAGDTLVLAMANFPIDTLGEATAIAAGNTLLDDLNVGLFDDIFVGDTITVGGFTDPANNGAFTVATKPDAFTITVTGGSLVDETAVAATFSVVRNYSGSYTTTSIEDGWLQLDPAETTGWVSTITVTCSVQFDGKSEYTDWVTLPDTDRTEVWCNVLAPNGMFKDNGGKSLASVSFEVEIEQLDSGLNPLGIVEVVSGTLSGAVPDERGDTVEHATAWTGPARVRMRRTTNYDYAFSGTVLDEVKWSDLYSVSPVATDNFGNKTTIHTVTQATERATSVKSRQLSCFAARKLPTYDGTALSGAFNADGLHTTGTISATSRMVDIIAAVSVDPKIGARDLDTEVDMAQIWAVQQQLDAWNAECGQFNYTFDSDALSFEETIISIANAAFCIAYRQNGKIRLALDRAQPSSTALFTHRNKKPNAEAITRRFSSDSEYDGVEFVYVDPDSNQSETITLPLDGNFTKLKKFEIAGIRSFSQAWLRANREYRKLLAQRISIETTTTMDARALTPNSRVDIVDNTRFKSYDGEVVSQDGLLLTLSRDVAFTEGAAHSIVLMRRDGTLQSIACTAGTDSNQVVLQSLPSEAVVTSYGDDGIRTIYSFAADSARGAMAYLVQELDISDGQYATIRAINYSADYYEMDEEAVPPKESVIS